MKNKIKNNNLKDGENRNNNDNKIYRRKNKV